MTTLSSSLRFGAFRVLERVSQWRRAPAPLLIKGGEASAAAGLWVYATSIGELQAIEPFLRALLPVLGGPALTLISNHAHYSEAYLRKFPLATFACMDGDHGAVSELMRCRPPMMLIVAEIPALLHDAPCRFSYATLAAVRRAGAPAVLVNGWLYGDGPPSRMDRLESRWFARDYVRRFNLMLVQSTGVREALLEAGVDPSAVQVVPNFKYEALAAGRAEPDSLGALAQRLKAYVAGPVVVAGSLRYVEDERQLLDAFKRWHSTDTSARLVLAPRHPENADHMAVLAALLTGSGLTHAYRSRLATLDHALAQSVLVLDTVGELRDCYAAATFAFVGADHNVLEPLAFGTIVHVAGEWHSVYPSFPVYRQCLDEGLITALQRVDELDRQWMADAAELPARRAALHERLTAFRGRTAGSVKAALSAIRAALPALPWRTDGPATT